MLAACGTTTPARLMWWLLLFATWRSTRPRPWPPSSTLPPPCRLGLAGQGRLRQAECDQDAQRGEPGGARPDAHPDHRCLGARLREGRGGGQCVFVRWWWWWWLPREVGCTRKGIYILSPYKQAIRAGCQYPTHPPACRRAPPPPPQYLDMQNRRPDFIANFIDNLVRSQKRAAAD